MQGWLTAPDELSQKINHNKERGNCYDTERAQCNFGKTRKMVDR